MALFVSRDKAAEFSLEDLLSEEGRSGLICVSQSTWMLAYSLVSFYGYWRSRYYKTDLGGNRLQLTDEEFEQVTDIVDLAVEELSMTGYSELIATLNALTGVIEKFEGCCANLTSQTAQLNEASPSDGSVVIEEFGQFETVAQYLDGKCNAANAIYDTVLGFVTDLSLSDIDAIVSGVFGGVVPLVGVKASKSGPLGWALAKVSSFVTAVAFNLIDLVVDFGDIATALDDKHEELVLGLFNSGTTVAAKASFLSVLATATPTLTSSELALVSDLLPYDMINQLFDIRQDIAAYQSSDPINCGGVLAIWSFVGSGQGWTFRDDSTGSYSASGAWDSGDEAWEINLIGSGTLPGPRAIGTIFLTGLSIPVAVGNSIQVDYGPTSDGVSASIGIKAVYSDMTSTYKDFSTTGGAGVASLDIPSTKVLAEIEVNTARNWTQVFNITRDLREVRVQ